MLRSSVTTSRRPRRGPVATAAFAVLVFGVVVATLGAALFGNPALAVAPVLGAGLLMAVTTLPLRTSTGLLLILLLGIDDHMDYAGTEWRTPLAIVGDMMNGRLDKVLGIPGLGVTGMEIAVLVLLGIYVYRRATGSRIDTDGQVPLPAEVRDVIAIYFGAVVLSQVVGIFHGLPASPWKLRNLLHPIVMSFLFMVAFRPRDLEFVGKVLALCAGMRAVEVIIVQRLAIAETGGRWDTATSHGDSIPFAVMIVVLLLAPLEFPTLKNFLRTLLLLPLMLLGALENERRLVWVMILLTLGLIFLMVPMAGWKLRLTKILLVAFPVLAIYIGVGWDSKSAFFGPVETIRSVVDTSVDHSAYWREVEDFNIALTIKDSPLLGQGLSGHYSETMANDDITALYAEYKEWPHNSVLGLLMLMGLVGFTGIWLLLPVSIYLAARAYRASRDIPEIRVAALGAIAAAVACLVQSFGDLGAHFSQYKVYFALAVAFSAKLAVASRAYPVPGTEAG
jgi:O-antigen ligase